MPVTQYSLFDNVPAPAHPNAATDALLPIEQAAIVPINPAAHIQFEPVTIAAEIAPIAPAQKTIKQSKKNVNLADLTTSLSVPSDDELFKKKYYSIGLVAKMFNVNISLIRYWEKEFTLLKPKLNGKGDRHFRPEDVKNLQLIYHLLREKRYTLDGAKEFLKKNKSTNDVYALIEDLKKIKHFLIELKLSL